MAAGALAAVVLFISFWLSYRPRKNAVVEAESPDLVPKSIDVSKTKITGIGFIGGKSEKNRHIRTEDRETKTEVGTAERAYSTRSA
jgi:hypothetical protein